MLRYTVCLEKIWFALLFIVRVFAKVQQPLIAYLSGQVQMILVIALDLGAWVRVRQNGDRANNSEEEERVNYMSYTTVNSVFTMGGG